MTFLNSLLHLQNGGEAVRAWQVVSATLACIIGPCVTAEFMGYWLHRLLHSGWIRFLSRNHMKHHLVLYGPLDEQRSHKYHDVTHKSLSLGNIGVEWLIPAALLIMLVLTLLHFLGVSSLYRVLFLGGTLGWSFVMFSYLHDVMHIKGFWLERNRLLKGWFRSARRLHDIHHCVINNRGLMDKNFGIGFFFFDRLFGTFSAERGRFNRPGYEAARRRFQSLLDREEHLVAVQ